MSPRQFIRFLIAAGIAVMLTSTALGGKLRNVAPSGMAKQSSGAYAERAIDGNRDSRWGASSCIQTGNESSPWWRVDLKEDYKIDSVIITSRTSNQHRLSGAEIWIGKSPEVNSSDSFKCAVISHIPKAQAAYFPCSSVEGRYVTVLLRGSHQILSFCELEVFPAPFVYPTPNLALRGEATQSSTLSFAVASKAIDGTRHSFYNQGSCSHTAEGETDPWWSVDLGQTYIVKSVKITNRADCCAERLDGAEIRIGDSPDNNGIGNPRCASIVHIPAGTTSSYSCEQGHMRGRYVTVFLPGSGKTLTLCEVEVYGTLTVEPLPNVAPGKPVTQSSTPSWGKPQKAIDQCRSTNYTIGCCSSTYNNSNPWWTLDLLSEHVVRVVTITNRQDCCSTFLHGARVRIGNNPYRHNRACSGVWISKSTSTYTYQCNMKGRYVNVDIRNRHRYLQLCEVEVYGFPAVSQAPVPTPSPSPTVPPPPPATASMQLNGRNVTVVGEKLCWSDALLYCRRHHWDLLSIQSPQEQSQVEQLLRNTSHTFSGFLWLGLRRYVMNGEWFWMSGDAMCFSKWAQVFVPLRHLTNCGGMANGGLSLWHDQPCQELHHFACQSGVTDAPQRVYFYSTKSP